MEYSALETSTPGEFFHRNYSDTCPRPNAPDTKGIVMAIFYIIILIVGVIGNATVIYVVLRYAKMKTVTNWYILNLAVADSLFLVLGIPFWIVSTLLGHCFPFGRFLCPLVFFVDGLNQFTGINCLVVMSIDRYIAVCCAMRASKLRNLNTAMSVNVLVWIISLVSNIPIALLTTYHADDASCGMEFSRFNTDVASTSRIFILYMGLLGFFIPLSVIAICYSMIVVKLRLVSAKTGKLEKSRKVNRLVLGVVLVFIACWGPFYMLRIILAFFPHVSNYFVGYYLMPITTSIAYVNSCANCFLYAFLSESFKKSFQSAWSCARPRELASGVLSNSSGDVLRSSRRRRAAYNNESKWLDCFRSRTHCRLEDDNYISGVQNNTYPLTAVTSAVSETQMQKNGKQ